MEAKGRSFIVFVSLLIWAFNHQSDVLGLKVGPGKCPDKIYLTDFDFYKGAGKWYFHKYMTNLPVQLTIGTCPRTNITIFMNKTQPLYNITNTFTIDLGYKYNYDIKGLAIQEPFGRLQVALDLPLIGVKQGPLWILSTDYKDYAIAYSCMTYKDILYFQVGYILTRRANYNHSKEFDEAVDIFVKKVGLSPDNFLRLNQKNCD
ncbi:apolipoprotein D-like [Diaphorina citri]|uniref:Apolipoprotein D-like n=1 Tax=Diaphorina citri TaxID=121845 RepID=A0A1S3D7L4_DIACI|nr:apolipoprotein D-like [Diaphorina citri]KAI5746472.1 hypothetical protein M8J77_003918 [Diaphorina citri]